MATRTLLPSRDVAHLATDLRLACMRISRRIRYESTDAAGAVAPHQFSVLVRLEEAPRTPGELADIERVAKPSMTRTLAGLLDRGLIQRVADVQDRRQVIVSLTPQGRSLVSAIRRTRDAWMVTRVARLSPQEQEVLAQASVILARVAAE